MTSSVTVPDLVERRARSCGSPGERWLAGLPGVLADLSRRWDLTLGPAFDGGSSGLVVACTDGAGTPLALKVAFELPSDDPETFDRAVAVHRLAGGRGCARLVDHDADARAVLLERLGPNLGDLALPLPQVLTAIAVTLRAFWRPVDATVPLPTGADKAMWLCEFVITTWTGLGRPFERELLDRTVRLCDERAASFDIGRAVLVHADAHGWNTLAVGDGTYKFVDPEGLWAEPEHDLSVAMREYNEPLLATDPAGTARLVRVRAAKLAHACAVDADAVWEWGCIERVSTGLANLAHFGPDHAAPFFEVARRSH